MKRSGGVDHLPITQYVEEHLSELRRERECLPTLRARRDELRAFASTSRGVRRLLRRALDAEREAQAVDERIKALEENKRIHEFEKQVVPFLDAYTRHAPRSGKVMRLVGDSGEEGEAASSGAAKGPALDTVPTQADVVAEYLSSVQGVEPRLQLERSDMCPQCNVEMVHVPSRAILACTRCGRSSTFLDATTSAIPFDDTVEMVQFSYKRSSHMQDWIAHVQGTEAHRVPQTVIEQVMHELYRQRVTALEDVTTQRVRTILKQLRQRKCYDHTAQIVSRVTGRGPLVLPPAAIELVKLMFTSVLALWPSHCPPERKNMLSYSYCLAKMLYILGYDELSASIGLLKSNEKLKANDAVWRTLCASLDWPFYPTV